MFRKIFIVLISLAFVPGLLSTQAFAVEEIVEVETVTNVYKLENYTQIADNVVILFDTSGSMADPFHNTGMTKLEVAKRFLKQRAAIFPDVFPNLNVGLYGYSPGGLKGKGYDVFYKMQPFNKSAFIDAVDKMPEEASGPTLLQNAFTRLDSLLATLSGHTVVFLFTDGTYSEARADEADAGAGEKMVTESFKPVNMAKKLTLKYDVNLQVISTTSLKKNLEILKQVVSVNASSRLIPIELLIKYPEVYTGAVFAIEEKYIIDEEVREKVVGFKLDQVLFGFDKADIKTEFTGKLDKIGEILKKNPDSYIVLAGYTDSIGPEEYNLILSRQRVEAVGAYLEDKFAISKDRINLFWYGENAPFADNGTPEGRSQNRRVIGYVAGIDQ